MYATTRAEPEVDEDVRQMQSETDTLRRRSQAAGQTANSMNTDVEFPARTPRKPSSRRNIDITEPIALQETPQIEKNKAMRGESGHRRRSSVSRGKRVSSSYEATGVICEWHIPFVHVGPRTKTTIQRIRTRRSRSPAFSNISIPSCQNPNAHDNCSYGAPIAR